METRHTPGPWSHINGSYTEDGHYLGFKVIDARGKSVAAYSSAGRRPAEEQIANARLLAAAPDLLEALTVLVAGIEVLGVARKIEPAYEMALEAIAKATGGV